MIDLQNIPVNILIDCMPAGYILYKNPQHLWELGYRHPSLQGISLYILQTWDETFEAFVHRCATLIGKDEDYNAEVLTCLMLQAYRPQLGLCKN